MQHNAMLGAPNDVAVRQRKALYALSDEQSAAIDRLCFALERQSGKPDIRGILNRDERGQLDQLWNAVEEARRDSSSSGPGRP